MAKQAAKDLAVMLGSKRTYKELVWKVTDKVAKVMTAIDSFIV